MTQADRLTAAGERQHVTGRSMSDSEWAGRPGRYTKKEFVLVTDFICSSAFNPRRKKLPSEFILSLNNQATFLVTVSPRWCFVDNHRFPQLDWQFSLRAKSGTTYFILTKGRGDFWAGLYRVTERRKRFYFGAYWSITPKLLVPNIRIQSTWFVAMCSFASWSFSPLCDRVEYHFNALVTLETRCVVILCF